MPWPKGRTRKRRPAPEPGSMRELLPVWQSWMRTRNYSEHTVHVHGLHLEYFVDWSEERGISRPDEVSLTIIERYQRWLYNYRRENGKPLAFQSQHSRLVTLRVFFKWLARSRIIPSNPAADIEYPLLGPRALPKDVLTVEEAELVLRQPVITEPLGLRDRAMLETIYSTGMRRGELVNLRLYDIDIARGTVLIRQGKGHKDRVVPIGERALAWVEKYVVEVRPLLAVEPDEGVLFLAAMGQGFTPNAVSQTMRRYVEASGVPKSGACHVFRHTMATLMLENGADIRYIQEMLGHANLETTQIYTRVSIQKLKEIHTAAHPGAKLARTRSESTQQALTAPSSDVAPELEDSSSFSRRRIWSPKPAAPPSSTSSE